MTAPVKTPLFGRNARLFAGLALLTGGTVAAMSFRGEPQHRLKFEVGSNRPRVKAVELARWGIEGARDYVVVDLRPSETYAEGHVRGAVSCGTCHATSSEGKRDMQETSFVDLTKKVVLYTETGTEPIRLPKVLADNPRLMVLEGGWAAWQRDVMNKVDLAAATDVADQQARLKHEAVRAFYAGERPSAAPAALPMAPIKREGSHAPAKASEGC